MQRAITYVNERERRALAGDFSKRFYWPMWPKVIQVNKTDVYVVGGNDTKPTYQNMPG